ncbi:hypothetical protein VTO58DRAFT_101188 [Aureobasidium pullulans]
MFIHRRVEPPFQSLAGLHDCRRLQQDILAHTTIVPGPLRFSSQQKQTCARKLSMSSNAVTSKWTWLPALHQESQNVPILKTKRSTMTNVVQIAEDDKSHSDRRLWYGVMEGEWPSLKEMFNGLRISCWQGSRRH